MASKYTEAEREAYKKGLAANKKKTARGSSTSRSKTRATARKKGKDGKPAKRSGAELVKSYKLASGDVVTRPKISAWRIDKNIGFQSLVAFLGKNGGVPKSDKEEVRERFRNMVVTLTSKAGITTLNGLWDSKYDKLKLIQLGLVVNPAKNYFGPGGSRLKDKATK